MLLTQAKTVSTVCEILIMFIKYIIYYIKYLSIYIAYCIIITYYRNLIICIILHKQKLESQTHFTLSLFEGNIDMILYPYY